MCFWALSICKVSCRPVADCRKNVNRKLHRATPQVFYQVPSAVGGPFLAARPAALAGLLDGPGVFGGLAVAELARGKRQQRQGKNRVPLALKRKWKIFFKSHNNCVILTPEKFEYQKSRSTTQNLRFSANLDQGCGVLCNFSSQSRYRDYRFRLRWCTTLSKVMMRRIPETETFQKKASPCLFTEIHIQRMRFSGRTYKIHNIYNNLRFGASLFLKLHPFSSLGSIFSPFLYSFF